MRQIITLITVLSFLIVNSQQSWSKYYGGQYNDNGISVQQTKDGGYIIAGDYDSYWNWPEVYLIKMEANGDTTWTKTYGGAFTDMGKSVQQTMDSGYIICGYTKSSPSNYADYDVYLIKTNGNGDTSWTKTYGGPSDDYGYSVIQTIDSGYVICGYTKSYGSGSNDIYLIKTNFHGDTIWTKTYGGASYDHAYSAQQTSDSGYIITGSVTSFGAGGSDIYLIKTDQYGDTTWAKTYGGTDDDYGNSVQQTIDKGFIIIGETKSYGAGDKDIYLIKTDENGDTSWTKTYGSYNNDIAKSVQQTLDSGYIIAGHLPHYGYGYGQDDVYLIKTNLNGDTLWTRLYGGGSDDHAYSVQQTSDSGYVIAGTTESFGNGNSDVYIIKTDINGDTSQIITFQTENNRSSNIYPNPFIATTTIELSSKPHTLIIYDIVGNKVRERQVSGITTIERRDMTKGVYLIEVRSDNQTYSRKLVAE